MKYHLLTESESLEHYKSGVWRCLTPTTPMAWAGLGTDRARALSIKWRYEQPPVFAVEHFTLTTGEKSSTVIVQVNIHAAVKIRLPGHVSRYMINTVLANMSWNAYTLGCFWKEFNECSAVHGWGPEVNDSCPHQESILKPAFPYQRVRSIAEDGLTCHEPVGLLEVTECRRTKNAAEARSVYMVEYHARQKPSDNYTLVACYGSETLVRIPRKKAAQILNVRAAELDLECKVTDGPAVSGDQEAYEGTFYYMLKKHLTDDEYSAHMIALRERERMMASPRKRRRALAL